MRGRQEFTAAEIGRYAGANDHIWLDEEHGNHHHYLWLATFRNSAGRANGEPATVAVVVSVHIDTSEGGLPQDWRGDWSAYIGAADGDASYRAAAQTVHDWGSKL